MTLPTVVMCSLWRSDVNRRLADRVQHLLAKAETYPALRWVWVVGDSRDNTTHALAAHVVGAQHPLSRGHPVQIVDVGSTGIEGDDMPTRLRRLSETANEWWNWCENADYVICHESDLVTDPDVVNQLVANAERGICPVAAWPTLEIQPGVVWCYDVWAYAKDGVRFTNQPPYHACYKPDEPFEVDSFGSVYLFRAEDVPLVRFEDQAVRDLCRQLKEAGRTLWCDPRIRCEQPKDLWQFHLITERA